MKPTLAQNPRSECELFASDLFHAISQPLTALRCSLELGLSRTAAAEDAHDALEQALQATERVCQLVHFSRQLAEADRIPALSRVWLDDLLAELRDEILPVAESKNVKMFLQEMEEIEVLAAEEDLARALFLVAEFALREMHAGEVLALSILPQGASAVVRMERNCHGDLSSFEAPQGFDVPAARRGLSLARHLLSSMGARIESDPAGRWVQIRLPRHEPRDGRSKAARENRSAVRDRLEESGRHSGSQARVDMAQS